MTLVRNKEHGFYVNLDDPGEGGGPVPRVSVTDEEGEILAEYVKGLYVLEIGTGLGISTRAMAKTAVLVDTVDIDPWVRDTIAPALPKNVIFHEGMGLIHPNKRFDVCFIDGAHDTASVVTDIEDAMKRLVPGGLLLFHDYFAKPVRDAVEKEMNLRPCAVRETRHKIGVVRLK